VKSQTRVFAFMPRNLISSQALNSDVITDSTWLPISHPDHSLGAGLGPPSEDDGEEKESDDGGAETDVEGELPWTPKFNKVSRGSSFRAAQQLRSYLDLFTSYKGCVCRIMMFLAAYVFFGGYWVVFRKVQAWEHEHWRSG